MSGRNYVSPEMKIRAVEEYLSRTESLNLTAKKYGVSRSTFQKWLLNYEVFGKEGLYPRTGNQHYSETLKRQAVELYLSGQASEEMVCKKYQIRSRSILEKWISCYTGQQELRPAGGARSGTRMTRNYEERKNAVEYCIAHDKNYSLTAEHFGLTYQQVYSWVRKYHAAGLERLTGAYKAKGSKRIPENKKLKTDGLKLEMELVLYRKIHQYRHHGGETPDFSGVRYMMEYQIIKELQEEKKWPVYKLCAALGVSRAAYYKWRSREASQKQLDDEELAQRISEIYQQQRGIPGYRQMKIILERRFGLKCNLKRIYRLMNALGLRSVCRRQKRRRTKKTPAEHVAENILNRKFSASKQNEKWLTDVTEFKYGAGNKAYLSAVLDLYGRNIVAFSFGHSNNNALVFETFDRALQRFPEAKPLLHSDRGVQYTSRSFREKMEHAGIRQSMSRVGCCLDNAPMEGFWGILKSEMYYPHRFDDYNSLYEAVCKYIDFYNNVRYQKNLGCMTPSEFIQLSDNMKMQKTFT